MSKDKQAVSFALMGRTFRLYFKMMRESGWGRTILYVSTSLLTGALYALNTPVMESLVTAVTNVAQGAGASVIILPAVLFFLCGAGATSFDNIGMYYQIVFEQRIRSGLMRRLMRAIGHKEPIALEDPENLESIEKAKKGVDGIHRLCSQYLNQGAYAIAYFGGMLIYVGLKSPLLAALLFLSIIPLALSNRLIMAQASSLSDQLAPEQRAADYCEKCLTDREYFKETRLLGAYAYFFKRYFGHLRECVRLNRRFTNHETLYKLGSDVLSLVGFAAVMTAMVFELKNGRLNPAGFAALLAGLLILNGDIDLFACTVAILNQLLLERGKLAGLGGGVRAVLERLCHAAGILNGALGQLGVAVLALGIFVYLGHLRGNVVQHLLALGIDHLLVGSHDRLHQVMELADLAVRTRTLKNLLNTLVGLNRLGVRVHVEALVLHKAHKRNGLIKDGLLALKEEQDLVVALLPIVQIVLRLYKGIEERLGIVLVVQQTRGQRNAIFQHL